MDGELTVALMDNPFSEKTKITANVQDFDKCICVKHASEVCFERQAAVQNASAITLQLYTQRSVPLEHRRPVRGKPG